MNAWKVLNVDRTPFHGGTGVWPEPGEWLEVEGDLVPCSNGIHLCRKQDIVQWLGPTIWEAEYDGLPIVHDESKIVVRKARLVRRLDTWDDRTARLFAADCAERVLAQFEREHPSDARPRTAIDVARRYAEGTATMEELAEARAAAGGAAGDAAAAAAGYAAGGAAAAAARAATWGAAWAISWAAAKAISWAVAGDVAGDAAEAAARYAAEAAAGDAAWDVARDAAEAAARYAAEAAARDAERTWQTERLWTYLYPSAE